MQGMIFLDALRQEHHDIKADFTIRQRLDDYAQPRMASGARFIAAWSSHVA